MLAGVAAQAVGLIVVAVAMEDPNLAGFLIGGGLAGAGAGVLFKSALAAYVGGAEPSRRGQAASSLFFFAYLGLIIPVLGIGITTLFVSAQTAMLVFAAALLVLLAGIATLALRQPDGSQFGRSAAEVASVADPRRPVRRASEPGLALRRH